MKKIMFIGAGFFQLDGIIKARELGYYSIGVDGNPEAEGKLIADEFHHIDITNKEAVLKLAREKEIHGVVSIASEVSMDVMSHIVSEMNLKGYDYDLVNLSHNKKSYYQLFEKCSIKIPKTIIYNDNFDLSQLIPVQSYIIKPSKGSGSRGVIQTDNITKFNFNSYSKSYLKENEDVIIQEIIDGKEMTVDGFIIDNKFYLLAFSEEINDKSKGHTFSSELIFPPEWIEDHQVLEIDAICNNIIKCLGINTSGPMHLELIVTPEGEFYLIDFSLRGGGFDVFTKIIEKTSGVDVLSLYLKAALGDKITPPAIGLFRPVTLSFIYPDEAGIIKKINGLELEGMHKNYFLKFLYCESDFIAKPESGKQRVAYYICWGEHHDSLFSIRDQIRNQISIDVNNE
jgi:biotin carboxylase